MPWVTGQNYCLFIFVTFSPFFYRKRPWEETASRLCPRMTFHRQSGRRQQQLGAILGVTSWSSWRWRLKIALWGALPSLRAFDCRTDPDDRVIGHIDQCDRSKLLRDRSRRSCQGSTWEWAPMGTAGTVPATRGESLYGTHCVHVDKRHCLV